MITEKQNVFRIMRPFEIKQIIFNIFKPTMYTFVRLFPLHVLLLLQSIACKM